MKQILVVVALLLAAECVVAQNPRAVLKSIQDGDVAKSTEKFEKIGEKSRAKSPELCYIAEAMLLNMSKQSGENKMRGYEILANNIAAISSSEEVAKALKSIDLTLEDAISAIEYQSFEYVTSVDEQTTYIKYLELARKAGHSCINDIERRLEHVRYQNIMQSESVEQCTAFLNEYPESEYRNDVMKHRTAIYYKRAMESNDEALLEQFIASYPDYKPTRNVANRLMQLRYDRIFAGNDVNQMKWFMATYPEHVERKMLMQKMADIEFATLESSVPSLEAFLAYYPYVEQSAEVRRRLCIAKVEEEGSVKHFVEYVKSNGYDELYPTMLRNIYHHTKRYIITPDINDATLIHFANDEGLAGYMDLEGNVVIEALYSCERPEYGKGLYNIFMLSEFTSYRPVAVTCLNGKWGVLDNKGGKVVDHNYQQITIDGDQIYAVSDVGNTATGDESGDDIGYYCDVFDFEGNQLMTNELKFFTLGYQQAYREFVNNKGETQGTYLTPKYCITHDNNILKLVDREGNSRIINWDSDEGVTDNIVVIDLNENGMTGRYFVDISAFRAIKKCPYKRVYAMNSGLAMVYDGQKYGFINEKLELVIPCKFDIEYATSFNCGAMVVTTGDKYALINTRGEYIVEDMDNITDIRAENGLSYNLPGIFITRKGSNYSIIDSSGATLVKLESNYNPTVVGNYVVDNEGNKLMFKLTPSK